MDRHGDGRQLGLVLGIIRIRCGGILLTYLVHATANTVIGVLAVALLR